MSADRNSKSPIERALTASPLGIAVIVIGVVLAIVFFIRLGRIASDVSSTDVKRTIEALQLTLPVLWLGFSLWGFQLIDTALERKDVRTRLELHQETLDRIEQSLSEKAHKRQVQVEKSKSFWEKFRGRS